MDGTRDTSPTAFEVSEILDLSAILVTGGLLVLIYTGASGILRILLALVFAFFVPGRAIVTNWPRMALWSEVAMPIVFSLASLALLAAMSLWAGLWRPLDLFQAEAWLSLGALCFGFARGINRGAVPSPPAIDCLPPETQ